ncbi:MAG: beta-galactosidase trimerization domain-containing protein [Anaerolineae bacterium]
MDSLPMRQVHLDFHTAGQIPGVGAEWDAARFVETLRRAHVNSITCFARCHHGYVYYGPTRFTRHPTLRVDLLNEQIAACHRAGIRVPIYVTVGWDELSAARHPEWQEVAPDGKRGVNGPLQAGWKKLCLNTPYLDYVEAQTREVLGLFGDEVDGLFFDIVAQNACVCPQCLQGMLQAGLNPERGDDRRSYAQQVVNACRRRLGALVPGRPDCTVFYNAGHISPSVRDTLDTYTHLELESLPSTGQWGYNHFPILVRYIRTLGKPQLGMTGKFHTSWGDFGSLKNPAALEFECNQMLANGAACSIGDQLHPRGALNEAAYDLIGTVYADVEAKEPWCIGAVPQADVAVLNVEAVSRHDGWVDSSNAGALRMLQEGHHQFDYVDGAADWSSYRVLVLPDKVPLDEHLADKVQRYLDAGGKVIASHRSGLKPDGSGFALEAFGVAYAGETAQAPDYLMRRPELPSSLAATEYVMYERGLAVRPLPGTMSLADSLAPYFERNWAHFCSHQHTPPDPEHPNVNPAITRSAAGNVIYLAHPIFQGYRRQAPLWYKSLFLAALQMLLPDPLVTCQAPSTAQVTLTRQEAQGRTIAHLLHYIPERRGTEFDIIEDVIPLYRVGLAFRVPQQPKRVYLAPQGTELAYSYDAGVVRVVVPEVMGHQMVVAE